jgi:hypothetical protein
MSQQFLPELLACLFLEETALESHTKKAERERPASVDISAV